MMSTTRQLLLGACLIAGRTGAFHVPVASSLSQHTRSTLAVAGKCNSASVRRRFRSAGFVMAAAASGEMQETIEARLSEALSPVHLEVINESHMHSGPAKESHFKVIVVSDEFEGKPLLARHRMVNALFAEEMKGKMHALSIQGKTPAQWEAEGHKVAPSPPCMGGSKADPSMSSSSGSSSQALGATGLQQGPTGAARRRGRHSSSSREALLSTWRRRRPSRFGSAMTAAGLLAVTVWLCSPSAASAAGSAAKAGAKASESANLVAQVDKAFWIFSENLGSIVNLKSTGPVAQAMILYGTAWMTTSLGPVAAAGVIGQPLSRALVATCAAHASFAAIKFSLAILAMSNFPPIYAPPPRRRPNNKPTPPTTPGNKPPTKAPRRKLEFPSLSPRRRGPRPAPVSALPGTRIQVRRSARSVPKLWLMALTAAGGPAMGAVGSAVAWKAGLVAMPAALSSLSRGSVISALLAGTLCYGGAGTEVVARWAVFQGIMGAPFAALLSPSALMLVYLCNYYWRVAKSRRSGPGSPPPGVGAKAKAGGGAPSVGVEQEGKDTGDETDEAKKGDTKAKEKDE